LPLPLQARRNSRPQVEHRQDLVLDTLFSFECNECGFKSNEIKCGGAVSAKGRKITLKITTPEDLSRDILKSETASVEIPDCDLELGQGTLGGRFTTIEGFLSQLKGEFESNPFFKGDSANPASAQHYENLMNSIKAYESGSKGFTLIIDDPMSNSHIQNIYAPDPDPNMIIEDYERTFEQNEDLGLNDIKTEGYETIEEDKK